MRELLILIPYHLAIPVIVSFLSIILILIFYEKLLLGSRKWLWIGMLIFFFIYGFIVGVALYDDLYYQWDLERYDLNQDGIFSIDEQTPEQEAASFKLINDTGRNFSIITGFILAMMFSVPISVFGAINEKSKKSRNNMKNHTQSSSQPTA